MTTAPSTRQVVRIVLAVAATAGGLYLLYEVRGVLELIGLGLFVALSLGPFVEFLTRRRAPRVVAILTAYVALLGSIVFLGLVAVPPIAGQIEAGVHQLPAGIAKLREDPTFRKYDNRYKITPKLAGEARTLPSRLAGIAKQLSAVTVGAFSAVTKLVSVLALAFFLLRDGPQLSRRLYRIRGPDHEERFRRVGTDIYHSVAGYVAGNLGISLVAGLVAYIALTAMGIPFAAALAVIVGVFDLLPLVGATIAAVIVGIVTLFYSFPTDTIIWAVVVIVYQQIENNVLSPVVYRRTVQVPGMLVLISVLVGATLGGIIGALLAIPAAAAIQIVARDMVEQRRGATADQQSPTLREVRSPASGAVCHRPRAPRGLKSAPDRTPLTPPRYTMIPLSDGIPAKRFPYVNVALIVANFLVWLLYEVPHLSSAVYHASFYPCSVDGSCHAPMPWVVSWLTSMFTHASWSHILGNMLFLAIFGKNVEDAFGHLRYLGLYIAGGFMATALQTAMTLMLGSAAAAQVPTLGASGAIAAVLGAYLVLFPSSRVLTLFLVFPIRVPAWIYLGLWFTYQLVHALGLFSAHANGGGVAFFAHVGGFVFGVIAARRLLRKQATRRTVAARQVSFG